MARLFESVTRLLARRGLRRHLDAAYVAHSTAVASWKARYHVRCQPGTRDVSWCPGDSRRRCHGGVGPGGLNVLTFGLPAQ